MIKVFTRHQWTVLSLSTACLIACTVLAQPTAGVPAAAPTSQALPSAEVSALYALRNSLSFTADQLASLRWNQMTDPCGGTGTCGLNNCTWRGIECTGGHVTTIDISDYVIPTTPLLLSGQLPDDLSALTQLEEIYMDGHSITGSLPASWSALINLQILQLSNNMLTGSLPGQWGGMRSLVVLNITNNQLSGQVPDAFRRINSLRAIDVRGNSICTPGGVYGSITLFQNANASCPITLLPAIGVPAGAPSTAASTSTPTPSPPTSNSSNQPILQMSTGINIAVSVVIGAFLLFGIIAGIIRVKRQQRQHQRWQRHRAAELRQREVNEEAAFRVMIQKFTPPSLVVDPSGSVLSIAQPATQTGNPQVQGQSKKALSREPDDRTRTAAQPEAGPSTSQSSTVAGEASPEGSQEETRAGSSGPQESGGLPGAVGGGEALGWVGQTAVLETIPPIRSRHLRHRRCPIVVVDVFISDKGTLTFDRDVTPALDSHRPTPEASFVTLDLGTPEPWNTASPKTSSDFREASGKDSRLDGRRGNLDAGVQQSAPSTAGMAPLDIEARRRERIGNLQTEQEDEQDRANRPPAPLLRSARLRRLFGMETLEQRDRRLRAEADRAARRR